MSSSVSRRSTSRATPAQQLGRHRAVLELRLRLLVDQSTPATPARWRLTPTSIRQPSPTAQVYIGNDGGVYARPLWGSDQRQRQRHRLEAASTPTCARCSTTASASACVPGGVAVAGGLQDNGTSLLLPEDAPRHDGFAGGRRRRKDHRRPGQRLQHPHRVSGAGSVEGDRLRAQRRQLRGDRRRGTARQWRALHRADRRPTAPTRITGSSAASRSGPMRTGSRSPAARNGCEPSTGAPATRPPPSQASRDVIWSAWCGPCNNDGFARGISTNPGGSWHQLALPARGPQPVHRSARHRPRRRDRKAPSTSASAASRASGPRVPAPATATSGRRPTAAPRGPTSAATCPTSPSTTCILNNGKIVLATDLGVVVSANGGASWSRLGRQPALHDGHGLDARPRWIGVCGHPRPRHLVGAGAIAHSRGPRWNGAGAGRLSGVASRASTALYPRVACRHY